MNATQLRSSCLKGIALGILLTSPAFAQDPDAEKPPAVKPDDAAALKGKQTIAISNLRQLGLALFEFETEFGEFPNEKTAAVVKEASGTAVELKGATADDCFRQLIGSGIMPAKTADQILSGGTLGKGEDAKKPAKWIFSYAAGLNAAGNPNRPLAFYPMIQGKTTFDPEPLAGRAVILFIDNSVKSFPIEKDGTVLVDGKDMFDPAQGYWGGKALDIKWPAK